MSEKVIVPPHIFACLDAEVENYIVDVDLPGVKKKDIDLSMHEDIIHVLAEREDLAFHGHLHFPIKVNPTFNLDCMTFAFQYYLRWIAF